MPKVLDDPRSAILKAVRMHVQEEGWSALNIRTIALRTGFAQGTVYNYFASREAIASEVIRADWQALAECAKEFGKAESDAEQNLAILFHKLAGFMGVYRRLWEGQGQISGTVPSSKTVTNPHPATDRAGFRTYLEALVRQALVTRKPADGIAEEYLPPFLAGIFLEWSRAEGFEYTTLNPVLGKLLR